MFLKQLRIKAGLTQLELAEQCGCDRTMIVKIEKGEVKPGVDLAKRIGKVLDFDWTLFYEDKKGSA